MRLSERLFRVLSLLFLTVGFIVSAASAETDTTASASIRDLVQDIRVADEINDINDGRLTDLIAANSVTNTIPNEQMLPKPHLVRGK